MFEHRLCHGYPTLYLQIHLFWGPWQGRLPIPNWQKWIRSPKGVQWVRFILTQSHYLGGGLEHELTIFPNSWEDDPIWLHLTFIYFSEVSHQPVMVTQECFGKQKMNGMVSRWASSRVVIRTHYKKAFAYVGLKPNTSWLKRCKHVFLFVWRVHSSDIIQRFKIPKSYITI
jgi:hypothetical protein